MADNRLVIRESGFLIFERMPSFCVTFRGNEAKATELDERVNNLESK